MTIPHWLIIALLYQVTWSLCDRPAYTALPALVSPWQLTINYTVMYIASRHSTELILLLYIVLVIIILEISATYILVS